MLMASRYTQDYVDACRSAVTASLRHYEKLCASQSMAAASSERQFCNHLLLALDRYFVHRGRGIEGKDGNPLNEVRMLCDSILENNGRMHTNKSIRYEPERSILKIPIGDEIQLDVAGLTRLSAAFLDEIEKKYL